MRIIESVERELGTHLPLSQFLVTPSIAELTAFLESKPEPANGAKMSDEFLLDKGAVDTEETALVVMGFLKKWSGDRVTTRGLIPGYQIQGERPPIFWVFSGGKEYRRLRGELHPQQPLYAMRSGKRLMAYSDRNIQQLASVYAEEIEAILPQGPFVLGGNCQGGIIAMAVAQRLRQRGRRVPLLVLLELFFDVEPYPDPVLVLFGRDSEMNPWLEDANAKPRWLDKFTDYRVEFVPGKHRKYFKPPYVAPLSKMLSSYVPFVLNGSDSGTKPSLCRDAGDGGAFPYFGHKVRLSWAQQFKQQHVRPWVQRIRYRLSRAV